MPPPQFWEEEDEWETERERFTVGARHVRAPRRARDDDFAGRRTAEFLVPEARTTTSLHRTRSQGHAPAPNVTIYNTTRLDNESNPNVRTEQKSPAAKVPVESARGRSRRVPGEWGVEDELAELRLDIAKQGHSRSRSRHHEHSPSHEVQYERWKAEQANQRLKEQEDKVEMERREELVKRKMELRYFKDKAERDAAEARIQRSEEEAKRREEFLRRDWELSMEREHRQKIHEEDDAKKREQYLKREWELNMEREHKQKIHEEDDAKKREQYLKREWELKQEKERLERLHEEQEAKLREEYMKRDWELKQEREERKKAEEARQEEEKRQRIIADTNAARERRAKEQEEERKRIIAENTLKMEQADKERMDARQRAVDEFNKEKAEKEAKAKAERDRVVAEYEAKKLSDAAAAKKQREELVMQLRIEEENRKKAEQEEWERFLMKQKKKEEEEKEKKEKQEKELEDEMRKRLAHLGFQDNQIQAIIKPEEAHKLQQGMTPANPLRLTHQPTYVKVHKEHLAVDTLLYYDIPYEIDRADPNYIIILREMEPHETEILFQHTRRLRTRTGTTRLLIEERNDHGKPEYAWVRRRKPSRSPSRRRSSPKRVVGLKEMFF